MARKIPQRVQRIVRLLEAGKTLCVGKKHSDIGDELTYWFEPGGASCGPNSVTKALDLGLIALGGSDLGFSIEDRRAA